MKHDDIIQYERDIRAYNKKGWRESKGSILLHKALELIEHYKAKVRHLEEQLNPKT